MSKSLSFLASAVLIVTTGIMALPASAQEQSVESLQVELNQAVCSGNWDDSVTMASRLIGSDEITPERRQELVTYRHQLQNLRASNATPPSIPECAGIATFAASEPIAQEPVQRLDWVRAAQSLGFSSGARVVSTSSQERLPYNFSASISRIVRGDEYDPNEFYAIGTVTNTGTSVATLIEVFYDSFSRVEGYLERTGSFRVFVDPEDLLPGQTATFEAGFERGQVVRITAVDAVEANIPSTACYPQQDCDRTVRASGGLR